jgi:uncharacterized protein (TIGR03437 family)
MNSLIRRISPFLIILLALVAGSPLFAYPVAITINVTFSEISGQPDPIGLGAGGVTGTITSTLDSASATGSSATYPATVYLTIPDLETLIPANTPESGTITITTNGQITANFAKGEYSFSAAVVLPGLTLPSPSASSFGTKSFTAPTSTTSYNLAGTTGTVGITGTISATGLTATPLAGISASATQNGAAPTPQQISVASNGAAVNYAATVSPSSATWLTLTGASGTTPGTVTANFSTALSPGTYHASVLVNDAGDSVGPLSIPVTYTVSGSGPASQLQVSPSAVNFNFFLPSSVNGSQTIEVTSSGAAASYSVTVSGASFITVTSNSGITPGSFTIKGNGTGLSNGTYYATVNLSSSVGSASIPVTINVTGASGGTGISPITVSPNTLTYNITPGETPAPQTVQLTSATPVSFTVGNVALYLPISPLSGKTPATLSVPLNVADLTPGTHIDYVQIITGSTSAELTVTVNVGTITLSSATTALAYAYPATSGSPLTQTVTISQSSGAAAVPLVVTPSVPWLTATVSGDIVTITANPDGLSEGSVTGNVVISSPLGANTVTIPVTFTLNSQPPGLLSVSPTALAFTYQIGGATLLPQVLTISALPAGSTLTVSAFGASWLSVTSEGVVSVNPQGLVAGVYTGSVRVSGTNIANAPYFVPVTLTVAPQPTFGISPANLTFSYQPGGAAPASQTLALASTVSNYVAASANVSWLSISPAAAAVAPSTPSGFTITAVPGSLGNGSYSGVITLVGGGAVPQTVTVPVTLDIAAVAIPVLTAITNAESYAASAGSPGGLIALWGTGLGPNIAVPLQLATSTTVATTAGGTQVLANGIPCPILFSSDYQVNAVLPFSLAGQTSTLISVSYQGVTSNTLTLALEPAAPGLFSLDGSGQGGGAILNSDLSVNTQSNPAAAGSIIVLYGAGAGQTNPPSADGAIVPPTSPIPAPVLPVTATIAGQPADILYAGDAPDLVSGVLQVNVVIPPGTPSGPQPVVITVGTASSQANLDVWVQ